MKKPKKNFGLFKTKMILSKNAATPTLEDAIAFIIW